jgi:hypothetical protein
MEPTKVSERGKNLALTVAAIFLALFFCEIALRIWHGVPPLEISNFHANRAMQFNLEGMGRHDRTLGWSLKENLDSPGLHTLEHGVRRNSAGQTGLRPGNVLAVGSSFTEGYQVADEQSWPAQLERLTGKAVDNAAVPGYALDQIVLRAEQLLPVAQPRVLLIGLMNSVIAWNSYAVRGRPKPFFTVDHGSLLAHNDPVPEAFPFRPVNAVFGYSHLIDRVMVRIDPAGWGARLVTIENDPVDVGCRLLQRLKQKTDKLDIRGLVVSELTEEQVTSADTPPQMVKLVQECARAVGYEIVDTFDAFRTAYTASPKNFSRYYEPTARGQKHFSELGNHHIAKLAAAALASGRPHSERP